jgi:hypothetical protein
MTNEEIKKAAKQYTISDNPSYDYEIADLQVAFIAGVKWTNEQLISQLDKWIDSQRAKITTREKSNNEPTFYLMGTIDALNNVKQLIETNNLEDGKCEK